MTNELKFKVAEYADSYLQKLVWGYVGCKELDVENILFLSEVIDRESLRARYGETCLCPELVEKLNHKINKFLGKSGIDSTQFKDTTGKNFWQYTHPHCIRTKHYQKWCNQFLCDLDVLITFQKKKDCDLSLLTFISKEDACNLTLDMIKITVDNLCKLDVSTVIREQGCDIGAQVFVAQNYCKLESNYTLNETQCKLAHNTYKTTYNCDIEAQNFKSAIQTFII